MFQSPEVVRVVTKIAGELFIIEKAIRICNPKEEPSEATEMVSWT